MPKFYSVLIHTTRYYGAQAHTTAQEAMERIKKTRKMAGAGPAVVRCGETGKRFSFVEFEEYLRNKNETR